MGVGQSTAVKVICTGLDLWSYLYYNIYMRKVKLHRPNTSIRIDPEILHKAKIEAVKAKMSLGEWLEAAIKEKIEHGKRKDARQ